MIIWRPGQPINKGKYIIQGKPLGIGGFGITYKALEPKTGKLYAVKTLNQEMQLRDDFAAQQVKFINEALKIASFDHKHIVKVHEVIEEVEVIEEEKFRLVGVVMEYIDGVTLFKYVQNKGQLSETEALLYINQISQALEYIHAKGSLHRDIKPENILLRQNEQEAVLIDFGSTRSMAKTSMTISLTEGYAPIEQYRDKGNFGPHTDVYALAATLYYLLTADGLKRDSKSTPAPAYKREQIKTFDFLVKPKVYNQSLSQRVNDAILEGMELEPKNRTQTVLKFRENLGLVNIEKEQEIQLKSSCGMDYRQLCDLLAAEKWKEADEETSLVMLAVAKREKEGILNIHSIDNFPCKDLHTIDQLWVKYSDGKFGFSVQKQIYQSLGGTRKHNSEIWQKFGEEVGWRRGGDWLSPYDITFNKTAPKGCLPRRCHKVWGLLFSRIETCKL
ncbi:GUN4 domain-containing protein [Dolichospermum sp. FACHB-1091]|uniref:serine/threonine-protein kinase n=1 Tax=Dolichospermum sp. FACHB-1091 TaxID=2692798 RepID=UPI001681BDCE|nr:serine/threonine-protein kinase [Dolichospermum sp. FACHB-1091]MBD2443158.1 GUN4 domain-containing protein [Dolichospermum sp. FACHB-1091]